MVVEHPTPSVAVRSEDILAHVRIAVVGKGGSGKSVVAGTLARLLGRSGRNVLALDSDPIPGLAISLGLGPLDDAMMTDAAVRHEDGRWRLQKGIGAATAVKRFSVEAPDGVRLIQFGKASKEGLGPVMPSLNAFYQMVHKLARDKPLPGWSVVGDLPAGPRQAAFDWAPYAKTYLLVVEPTWQSILTARRVSKIVRSRRGVRTFVVANKVQEKADAALIEKRMGEKVIAAIPNDPGVRRADIEGAAVIDVAPRGPAVRAIEGLLALADE